MTRVEVETEHEDAQKIALSVVPDNTDEMETRIEEGRIITRIEREDVESAGATADDYLRNLVIADELFDAL